MDKLYIVEGIPGSGKTTLAGRLAQRLGASLYVEGDSHPADTAWQALLSREEYEKLQEDWPEYARAIRENVLPCDGAFLLAYTKLEGIPRSLYDSLEEKELYDGRSSLSAFCGTQAARWEAFGKSARGCSVFECVLLQNTVNELLLFHCQSEGAIEAQVKRLLRAVERLQPTLIYLKVDVAAALERAAAERLDEQGNRVWEARVIEYVTQSPYGRQQGLEGYKGMEAYFRRRQELELELLHRLPAEVRVLETVPSEQTERTDAFLGQLLQE